MLAATLIAAHFCMPFVVTLCQGRFRGVAAYRMGQRNMLGGYPFHWHLLGTIPSGSSYAQDCSVYHSYFRCESQKRMQHIAGVGVPASKRVWTCAESLSRLPNCRSRSTCDALVQQLHVTNSKSVMAKTVAKTRISGALRWTLSIKPDKPDAPRHLQSGWSECCTEQCPRKSLSFALREISILPARCDWFSHT